MAINFHQAFSKYQKIMASYEKRDFVIHYGGRFERATLSDGTAGFSVDKYVNGKTTKLLNVDGDCVCFLDFVSSVATSVSCPSDAFLKIVYLLGGVMITCSSDEDVMLMWKDLEVDQYGFSHIFAGCDDVEIIPTPCALPPPRSIVVVDDDEVPVIVVEDDDFSIVAVEEASNRKRIRETSVEPVVELILDSTPQHRRGSWVKMEEVDISNIEAEEEYHSNNSSEGESDDEFVLPQGGGFSKDADNVFANEDSDDEGTRLNAENVLQVGMQWPTILACRKFLKNYCIKNKFVVTYVKNERYRIRVKCKADGCPWFANFRRLASDKHTIECKKMCGDHVCIADENNKNPMADCNWIMEVVEDGIKNHQKSYKPFDIQEDLWWSFGVKVSYWSAWHARAKALQNLFGSYEDSYNLVPELCNQVLISNPGSIAKYCRSDDGRFLGLCVAFKASLDGFVNACRPIIGLDGCFLKGKFGGQCLSIIGLDGDNGLFPIAVYICRSESTESWTSFLEHLAPYLNMHPLPLTIISDRQKGLVGAVGDVLPEASHRVCFRHMYQNFKKEHKGSHLENLAWDAARAYKLTDFNRAMEKLEVEDKDAKAWLDNAEPVQAWARSQFDHTSKSDHITNNFSESFNKWILELRDKPIVTFIDGLHIAFMKNIYDRKQVANELGENEVLPRVKKLIAKYVKLINNYIVRGSSTNHVYMVRTQYGTRWEVNLVTKECSCIKWQLSGLPCVHAVAVLHPMRCDWVDYTHPYMSVRAYKETYAGSIRPMADLNDWDKNPKFPEGDPQGEPIIVLPPPFVRGIGRPKKNRKRAPDEPAPTGKVRHCKRCNGTNHNSRTCKGVPAPKKKYTKKGKEGTSTSSNEPTPIASPHQQQQSIAAQQQQPKTTTTTAAHQQPIAAQQQQQQPKATIAAAAQQQPKVAAAQQQPIAVAQQQPKAAAAQQQPIAVAQQQPKAAAVQQQPIAVAQQQPKAAAVQQQPIAVAQQQPKAAAAHQQPIAAQQQQPKAAQQQRSSITALQQQQRGATTQHQPIAPMQQQPRAPAHHHFRGPAHQHFRPPPLQQQFAPPCQQQFRAPAPPQYFRAPVHIPQQHFITPAGMQQSKNPALRPLFVARPTSNAKAPLR